MAEKPFALDDSRRQPDYESNYLTDMIPETATLEAYLEDCGSYGFNADPDLLHFLVRAISEKINYFSLKYNIQIANSDQFFLENFSDFVRAKHEYYTEKGIKRQDELLAKVGG